MLKKYGLILLLSISFLFGISTPEVEARSFEIMKYDIQVDIQEDGSALFTERITYDFDGVFNGVLYNLDISEIETPTDVKVSMQAEGQQDTFPFAPSTSEDPGTFTLENTEDFLKFTVYNPMEDEIQTVIYEYRLPEIITNYNDIAELNRKVIGGGWEEDIEDINISITLPQAVEDGELRAWGHGDREGKVTLKDNQEVLLTLPSNSAESFVEARVIFPTYVTPNNPNVVNEDKYDEIMAFEENLAGQKKQKGVLGLILGVLLGVVGIIPPFWLFRWLKRKNQEANPKPVHVPDHVYELPAEMTPAIMNAAVFNQAAGSKEITATIMDLIRKGYLQIEEDESEKKKKLFEKEKQNFRLTLKKIADEDLLEHEERLLHLFLDIAGNGVEVTLEDIENIGDDKEKAKLFNSEREEWVRDVEEGSRTYKDAYRAPHASKVVGMILLTFLANVFLFFLMGIIIGTTDISLWMLSVPLIGILFTVFVIFYHLKNPSLTMEGDRAFKEWRGFKNMLLDVGNFPMRDVGSIDVWGHYLVYAIALGVGDRVMEQLQIEYPAEELNNSSFGTYYYTHYLFVNRLNQSVTAGVTASSYTPNASGTGGGFSGGSSGGSGGGSGGGAF